MRPIPAPRLGDTHGLLRAISQRERLRLDEFITEFSLEELFPPGLENALGRTRQFVSFARSAGLLKEDRGTVELTEIGKRYVRAGDESAIFDVAPDQAEWLRRQLRERHMTDSIYHGAAIGLSLYASSPPDFRVSRLDFGRALAYLGRAGWDNENTLESQGERYTTFLRDLELIDEDSRLTETGTQVKAELTLPIHMSVRDLAGQLNPGGPEGAESEGEAEWAARAGEVVPAPAASASEVPAATEQPAPVPAAAEEEDEGDEYEEVRGGATAPAEPATPAAPPQPAGPVAATGPSTPAEPAPPGRPVPPSDIWETAAPNEVTRAHSAIRPEEAAAAAVGAAAAAAEPGGSEAADAEASATETAAPEATGLDAAGTDATDVDAAVPETAGVEAAAAAGAEPAAMTPGDPLGAPAPAQADPEPELVTPAPEAGDPLAAPIPREPEAEPPAPEPGDPLGVRPVADEPAAAGVADPADALAASPLADEQAGGVAQDEIPPVEAGDPVAAAGGVAAEAEADAPADAAPPAVEVGDPLAASPAEATEPVGVEGPGVESVSPEIADAVPPAAARREPSGFLDMGAVRAAAEDSGLDLPESVYASLVAALASGKHLVISGPAGSGKTTLALAVAKAAVQAGRSAGAALATASPKWSAHDTVGRVGESGFSQGHVLAAAGRKKWLLIDEIDRAKLDKAFGDLSSFLGGLPLSLPDGSREVAAPSDWRIVATRDTSRGPLEASPALLRRFAQVHLPQPTREELEARIDAAADGDATAAAAVKRLLAADLPGLGAGAFIDAARHAAERNALSPASEEELARECLAAYIAPHLNGEPGRIKELEDSLASPA